MTDAISKTTASVGMLKGMSEDDVSDYIKSGYIESYAPNKPLSEAYIPFYDPELDISKLEKDLARMTYRHSAIGSAVLRYASSTYGAKAGATIGAFGGPVGAVIGGTIGGVGGYLLERGLEHLWAYHSVDRDAILETITQYNKLEGSYLDTNPLLGGFEDALADTDATPAYAAKARSPWYTVGSFIGTIANVASTGGEPLRKMPLIGGSVQTTLDLAVKRGYGTLAKEIIVGGSFGIDEGFLNYNITGNMEDSCVKGLLVAGTGAAGGVVGGKLMHGIKIVEGNNALLSAMATIGKTTGAGAIEGGLFGTGETLYSLYDDKEEFTLKPILYQAAIMAFIGGIRGGFRVKNYFSKNKNIKAQETLKEEAPKIKDKIGEPEEILKDNVDTTIIEEETPSPAEQKNTGVSSPGYKFKVLADIAATEDITGKKSFKDLVKVFSGEAKVSSNWTEHGINKFEDSVLYNFDTLAEEYPLLKRVFKETYSDKGQIRGNALDVMVGDTPDPTKFYKKVTKKIGVKKDIDKVMWGTLDDYFKNLGATDFIPEESAPYIMDFIQKIYKLGQENKIILDTNLWNSDVKSLVGAYKNYKFYKGSSKLNSQIADDIKTKFKNKNKKRKIDSAFD